MLNCFLFNNARLISAWHPPVWIKVPLYLINGLKENFLAMLCPALCCSGSDAGEIIHFKPLMPFISSKNFALSQTTHLFLVKRASKLPHRAAGDHSFNLSSSLQTGD